MAQLLHFTPELRAQVEHEIERFLTGFGRPDVIRARIEISVPWNLWVSPSHASAQDIALAAFDIALWVFSLDDYTGEDYEAYYDQCLATLAGGTPSPERPVLRLFADHWERLATRGCQMERYVSSRKDIIVAYRRRNLISRAKLSVRFDEYLELRRFLIGTRVWLSAWEVLDDFWVPDDQFDAPVVRQALKALIYGQVLENDIYSLKRDIKSGTPNLVLMHAREHGLGVDDAVGSLRTLFRANEATFRAAKEAAARECENSARVRKLLEMMEICLEGSAALYRMKLDRYEIPPGE